MNKSEYINQAYEDAFNSEIEKIAIVKELLPAAYRPAWRKGTKKYLGPVRWFTAGTLKNGRKIARKYLPEGTPDGILQPRKDALDALRGISSGKKDMAALYGGLTAAMWGTPGPLPITVAYGVGKGTVLRLGEKTLEGMKMIPRTSSSNFFI